MLRSSILITALSLFGSFLGLLVQVLMAQRYGSGVEVDTYLYALSVPSFAAGLIASLLSYTVVPRMAHHSDNEQHQNQLIVSIAALGLCIGLILMLLSPALRYVQIQLLPKDSLIHQQHNLEQLLLLGWRIAATQIVLAALCAVLVGLQKPIIATALNLGPYVGMLVFMLTLQTSGTEHLARGLLAGTASSLFVAFFTLQRRVLNHWRLAAWAEVRELVVRSPYTIIAMCCFSIYPVVDSYWASRAGDGVLASLGYSQRIMIALGNLAIAGPSALLVPKFSEIVAKGIRADFDKMLKKTLVITLAISFTLAVGLHAGAVPLIELLFMRGQFDQNDAARVAAVLQYCLPGMVFSLLSVMCLRILFCFKDLEKPAAVLGIFWGLTYFSLSSHFLYLSGQGLALAYSLTWILYFFGAFFILINKKKSFFK